LAAAGLLWCGTSAAVEFGPFTLSGVAKTSVQRGSNVCLNCQVYPNEGKERIFADELVQGAPYGAETTYFTLVNPYLEAKFDLGKGFKLSGMLSERWRNSDPGSPGALGKDILGADFFAKNVAISHEDYGSVRVGIMPTRAWSVADYPIATNIGNSAAWADNGAGYGVNTSAIRYTSRLLDVAQGDLVLEATYDRGDTDWKRNKPRFWELWAQFHRNDLMLDVMYQDARNGNPQAFGKGPFTSLTPDSADDDKLGGSGQSILMAMGRYQVTSNIEATAGIRRNRWSGAYAVCVKVVDGQCRFNNMFNVNWGGTDANGVDNPGYRVTSLDLMFGLRYRTGPWATYSSLTHLGKASTDNPSERGQSNSATIGVLGLSYDYSNYWQFHVEAGAITYGLSARSSGCGDSPRPAGSCTLSPTSMGSNSFNGVDSRVTKSGNWVGAGVDFRF
jgi:hypothetical protein